MEAWQTIMLLGAIAIVCSAVLPRSKKSDRDLNNQSVTVRNMETALEQFMENLESDNRQMVELVTKSQQETQSQTMKREGRMNELEKRCAELELLLSEQKKMSVASAANQTAELTATLITEKTQAQVPVMEQNPAVEGSYEENSPTEAISTIRSRYSELFALHSNGKSVEAIAKKLGINKGEVQLILQLSKQEEAGRDE
ncbi:hypothetical protein Back11_21900 [Paenibacillus baekrokdamisoli]|uniref:Uncharacterized protein n=1 Tax=Paenibacillus baekrokdamisoli TaxID=1712516 RepID=A0A3G9IXF7_9BACL|nr:hypothetical protein [Paenibacillus baekrokdamisoli]MBB3069801.1 DNA repair exonuclease SbcCD nuclease subunit [Paenibacillus baekrokdamisoli]BBH20845.1 hypothetical protein Back11_21900 [Paenibacillus baekrokdamisoli]